MSRRYPPPRGVKRPRPVTKSTVKPKAGATTRARAQSGPAADPRAARLAADNRALRKSVRALMERVERAVDDQGSAFSWFQAAATLEETVRQRTQEYEQLNQRLTRELE
jgi:hypothetical protein